MVPVSDNSPFPEAKRGIVDDGSVNSFGHVPQLINFPSYIDQNPPFHSLHQIFDPRETIDGPFQSDQIPGIGTSHGYPADEPLQVKNLPQTLPELFPLDLLLLQLGHTLQTSPNLTQIQQRIVHPGPQPPSPHRGHGFIEKAEQ